MALFAPWLAPYDPLKIDVMHKFQGPSLAHWAGTDQLGRDLLSRIIYGARTALGVAITATGIAGLAGIILGLIAGFGPRRSSTRADRVFCAISRSAFSAPSSAVSSSARWVSAA